MQGSRIIPIGDIGEVKQIEDGTINEIHGVTIVGVSHLGTHKTYLRCSARVEPSSSILGRCTKSECAMLQRYDSCLDQLSAKMLFTANSKLHSITAYGKMIKDLAGVSDDKEVTGPHGIAKTGEHNIHRKECHDKVLQVMSLLSFSSSLL